MRTDKEIRGLKVVKLLEYLFMRKVLGKGPVDKGTLIRVVGYKGFGGYSVIENLEDQGLITNVKPGYMITKLGEQKLGLSRIAILILFKSKLPHFLIIVGAYALLAEVLHNVAPIDIDLIFTAIGVFLVFVGIVLWLVGQLWVRDLSKLGRT